jgi:hypothetical protein
MKHNDTDNNKSRFSGTETTESTANRTADSHASTGVQRLQHHRDELQDLAESDLPVAWVADALLGVADDADSHQDGSDGNGGGGSDP